MHNKGIYVNVKVYMRSNMFRQNPRIKACWEPFNTIMCIQPRLQFSISWQEIIREMPFCFEVLLSHFPWAPVSSLCQRVKKSAMSTYIPTQRGCVSVCVCVWLESFYVCIQLVLPGGFPNRKDIFRTGDANSVGSCMTEIIHQYKSVEIDCIRGRKSFLSF